MKVSKKRLLEILSEECGVAMDANVGLVDGEIDKEGQMAKRQLSDIADYSQELMGMLQDETQLESWVQAKLTKAADYIKTVKHYVEYGMEEGAYDQVSAGMPEMPVEMPGMSVEMPSMEPESAEYEYDPEEFDGNDDKY
jgi:hypothetical protein|tara:strand:+ start:162 stop:578 length:417 start_codon:yes stop_codon:yes gene_type:complete